MTTNTIKTKVHFCKSSRRWLAVNGNTIAFPPGRNGRRCALRWALAHDHPNLNLLVEQLRAQHEDRGEKNLAWLTDRLLKACQLITHGHVFNDGKVRSQTGSEVYSVTFEGMPKSPACNCADFERGLMRQAGRSPWGGAESDYGLVCKHILAVLLAEFAGIPLEDQPIPF